MQWDDVEDTSKFNGPDFCEECGKYAYKCVCREERA